MAQVINSASEHDQKVGTFDAGTMPQPDDLIIVGNPLPVDKGITIVAGAGSLARGVVLGKITASGKYTAYSDAASDGSQTAVCILGRSVDATTYDQPTFAYFAGRFNANKVTGEDAAGLADLQARGIFVETVSAY